MNEFTEMASKRYQRAWRGYEATIRRGGSAKLSSYCESAHVNYNGMKHWVAAHGLSVRHLRRRNSRRKIQIEENAVGGSPDMFVQFMPPTPMPPVPMGCVKIDFPDGVTLTLRECYPEGIVALLDTYERRRSAREAAECSR